MPLWSPEEKTLLRQLMAAGHSYRSAAGILGKSYEAVRSLCRRLGIESIAVDVPDLDAPPEISKYRGALTLNGDVVIVADVHCPCTDWLMATRVALIGQHYLTEPRRLVIVGDLLNFDAFSKYPSVIPLPTLRQEIDAARFVIDLWLKTFEHIYFTLGNHDYRWLKTMDGVMDGDTFVDIIKGLLRHSEQITVSVYPYLIIKTSTGDWRLTHPFEYAQTPLMKGRKLVHKHGCHAVVAHQHHMAVGLDESGRYALIDLPALVDPEKLAYVQLTDSTKPTMKRGFAMLKEGTLTVFSDQASLTDWSFWLPE